MRNVFAAAAMFGAMVSGGMALAEGPDLGAGCGAGGSEAACIAAIELAIEQGYSLAEVAVALSEVPDANPDVVADAWDSAVSTDGMTTEEIAAVEAVEEDLRTSETIETEDLNQLGSPS